MRYFVTLLLLFLLVPTFSQTPPVGSLGVGKRPAQAMLDVAGEIKIDTIRSAPLNGMIQYKDGRFLFRQNGGWVKLSKSTIDTLYVVNDTLRWILNDSLYKQQIANLTSKNLVFTSDRVHILDTFSVIIRQQGVHSLQLGADVPSGMIPIPNLKFSGLTGSNSTDSLMTLNGQIKGFPGVSDIYLPIKIALQGDPFGIGGGKYIVDGIYIDPVDTLGSFNLYHEQGYLSTYDNIDVTKLFQNGDYFLFDGNIEIVSWKLGYTGSLEHKGYYSNTSYVNYTSGGSVTIPDSIKTFIYNPPTLQGSVTIELPNNPIDGQEMEILAGGTITAGDVITNFTLDGNGSTIIGDVCNKLTVNEMIKLKYIDSTLNTWYILSQCK